ncbi:hypothetical protein F5Y16DRAFT_394759 [Xylariaceae sp. FL0255]|nr:hypothetical protein F5Y16DRAFT_394759 [Xylariaceae sp. FL0255]
MSGGSGSSSDTVGSLLAAIATSVNGAINTLRFADKSAWGTAEFEQLRLLEDTLDEAKKDFQELPVLVNGRFYYENDRKAESLEELQDLCTRFEQHAQNFKNWARSGGPIESEWAYKTRWLRRELHRAQCRAVRRIRDDLDATSSRPRCLGALLVWRSQQMPQSLHNPPGHTPPPPPPPNGEIAACNATGVFQRLGHRNHDIAFVCDFCDGFMVWENLRSIPSTRQRAASTPQGMSENWAATGTAYPERSRQAHSRRHSRSMYHSSHDLHNTGIELRTSAEQQQQNQQNSNHHHSLSPFSPYPSTSTTTTKNPSRVITSDLPSGPEYPDPALDLQPEIESQGETKTILFPPVAIANHLAPEPGDWQAALLCPLCDDYVYEEQGFDDVKWMQDERGFESVAALQEHLEWSHGSYLPGFGTGTAVANGRGETADKGGGGSCLVM